MKGIGSTASGVVSVLTALLVPSWWLLPQVLAGLGTVSIVSAGCVLWLERLQPLFATIAMSTLAYQAWLVWRRPRGRRTRTMVAILWASLGTCAAVGAVLVALSLRYW